MLYNKSWVEYFLRVAETVSTKSHCIRRKVGAVIVVDKRIVATGYNGVPSGFRNCNEIGECYNIKRESGENLHLLPCVHAETNAIHQAAKHGIAIKKGSLFISIAPCNNCLLSCISAGLEAVFYKEDYTLDTESEKLRNYLLENANNFKLMKVQ